jgi:hypothetical protein
MKKSIAIGIIVPILNLACVFTFAAELPAIPPIPEKFNNIKIIKPDPSVPKDVADLSGEWEGTWKFAGSMGDTTWKAYSFGQEVRRAKLIVYEVSIDKIKILYGWGASNTMGKGGWRLFESSINDDWGKKRFSFYGSWSMRFYLENGTIKGTSSGFFDIEMKPIK